MMSVIYTQDLNLVSKILPYIPNPTHSYLLIDKDDQLVGAYEIQEMSKILVNIHLHIIEGYQRLGIGLESYKELVKFMVVFSPYKAMMCTVPKNNTAMINGLQRTKWKVSGCIRNSIIWDDVLTDLIIFEHHLK